LDESGVELMWPAGDRTFAQYNIQLSTSNFAPLSLSIVYADNIGPDVVTVRSGPLTLPDGSFTNSAGAPNAFGPIITFPTPYTYAGGDLLITIRHTGHGLFSDHMDGVTGNALISGMASFGFDSPFEDGLFLRGSPVYQLQFEPVTVPEPTTFTLLAVGVLGGYARLRRKRAA
jgi:hypothetical protein